MKGQLVAEPVDRWRRAGHFDRRAGQSGFILVAAPAASQGGKPWRLSGLRLARPADATGLAGWDFGGVIP
jgi:hypothetical protein